MQQYNLLVSPIFLDEATNLSKDIKSKLVKCLRLLCNNFMHPSLQTKKIKGAVSDTFECRVDQSIRLIYDIHDNTIRCWHIGQHDAALATGERLQIHIDDVDLSHSSSESNNIFIKYIFEDFVSYLNE